MILNQEEVGKLTSILDALCKKKESYAFLQPVNYRELNLYDYPIVVKHPMDLGTIRKKLVSSLYSNRKEFISDVNLVWSNCKAYNQENSEVYKSAEKLEKEFNKLIKSMGLSTRRRSQAMEVEKETQGLDKDQNNLVSELMLYKKIAQLDQVRLRELVQEVVRRCPACIKEIDHDEIKLKLDDLSLEHIKSLIKFVDSLLLAEFNNSI